MVLCLCLLWLFLFLFSPRTGKYTGHAVISFVTSILIERAINLLHGDFAGPRFGPARFIINRELVEQRIRVCACEALDHSHLIARSSKTCLVGEIRRFNDECIAFPMPA